MIFFGFESEKKKQGINAVVSPLHYFLYVFTVKLSDTERYKKGRQPEIHIWRWVKHNEKDFTYIPVCELDFFVYYFQPFGYYVYFVFKLTDGNG